MAIELKEPRKRSAQALEKTYQNFLKEVEKQQKLYERHGVKIRKITEKQTSFFEFEASREALIRTGKYDKKQKNIARQLAEELVQPYTENQFNALIRNFYKEEEIEIDGKKQKQLMMNEDLRSFLEYNFDISENDIKAFEKKDVRNKDKKAKYIKLIQDAYRILKDENPDVVAERKTEEIGELISEYFFGS